MGSRAAMWIGPHVYCEHISQIKGNNFLYQEINDTSTFYLFLLITLWEYLIFYRITDPFDNLMNAMDHLSRKTYSILYLNLEYYGPPETHLFSRGSWI